MTKYRFLLFVGIITLLTITMDVIVAESDPNTPAAPAAEVNSPVSDISVDDIFAAIKVPASETFKGTLSAFESGDLVIVDRGGSLVKLRLYGVDSPETGQPFCAESKDYGSSRYLNTPVEVSIFTTDSLGIPVGLVLNTQRESLNHLLVATGMAWWDQRNVPKDAVLRRLGASAISNGLGLFSDASALAPWDYRKSHEIEDFTYALESEKEAPSQPAAAPKAEKEPVKTLAKKGTMTENLPRTATPPPAPAAAKVLKLDQPGQEIDPAALMLRHQPRIATDASGNPLGLTATDVGAIPYASQLGFQEGDIVSKVNGIAIESEAQIMSLIPQFENVKSFQVEVLRNGQAITIPINIP